MRVVVDTNVLVAALISPEGIPARLVEEIRAGRLQPVVGQAILAEYRAVLVRPHFDFPADAVADLIDDMVSLSLVMRPERVDASHLPDPDDAPFIAAALAAGCPVVTGNSRHFPLDCGVEVLNPAACLERVSSQ